MKTKSLILSVASIAALSVAAPALAQDMTGTQWYGTLGYSHNSGDLGDTGSITGRIGARFTPYLGVEGELGGGVKSDDVTVGTTSVKVKQNYDAAIYGVGFLPLTPAFDIIGRIGYGNTDLKTSPTVPGAPGDGKSWNYGVGGQYMFTGNDGVRVDYTRKDYQDNSGKDDVWAVSYVRKF